MNKVILSIMVGVAVTTKIMLIISTKRKIDKLNERIDDLECDMLREEEIPFIVQDMFEDTEHNKTKKDKSSGFFVSTEDCTRPI